MILTSKLNNGWQTHFMKLKASLNIPCQCGDPGCTAQVYLPPGSPVMTISKGKRFVAVPLTENRFRAICTFNN